MNTSTKTLPEGYAQSGEINLKKNKRLSLALNIVAFFVGILSLFLLSHQFPYGTMGDSRLAKILRRTFLGLAAKPTGSGAISTWRIK